MIPDADAVRARLLIGQLPADPSWPHQQAYEQILLPLGRIVIASIIAQVISELVDTEVFSRVYHRTHDDAMDRRVG